MTTRGVTVKTRRVPGSPRVYVSDAFHAAMLKDESAHKVEVAARLAKGRKLYGADPRPYLEDLLETANSAQTGEPVTWVRRFLAACCGRRPDKALIHDLNARLSTHCVTIQLPNGFPGQDGLPRDRFPFRLGVSHADAASIRYATLVTFLYERRYKELRRCARCASFLLDVSGRRRGSQAFCDNRCKNAIHNPRRDPAKRRQLARGYRSARRRRLIVAKRRARENELLAHGWDQKEARAAAIEDYPFS